MKLPSSFVKIFDFSHQNMGAICNSVLAICGVRLFNSADLSGMGEQL
jgi:hypothetical protein